MNHRFLVEEVPAPGERLRLTGDEARHARVLRLRSGEAVEIFDGHGAAASAKVVEISRDSVEVEIVAPGDPREPSSLITLALGLIQPDRFELAIQKGTELGVSRFLPVISRYTEIQPERALGKLERWRRIAAESTKQCGRARIPEISEPAELDAVVSRATDCIVFDPSGVPLAQHARRSAILLVGPEGGWDAAELDLVRRSGAEVATLGARRLRAETAAIVAVAAVIQPWR